jgi:hypothetical protein
MQSCSHKRSPPMSILSHFNPVDFRTNLPRNGSTLSYRRSLVQVLTNAWDLPQSLYATPASLHVCSSPFINPCVTHHPAIQSVCQRRSRTAEFDVMVLSHIYTQTNNPPKLHSTVLLQQTKLGKEFPTLYGTCRFITVFTTAYHLSLSWAKWTHLISL